MDLFGKKKITELTSKFETLVSEFENQKQVNAMVVNFGGRSMLFDGEKTPNELGTPYNFELDYQSIRMRAWEGYIKSTVIQTAIKNYCMWIIGAGLKFQAEPNTYFLKLKKINIENTDFTDVVEAQFRLFANDKQSTYSKQMNLHALGNEALKNAIMSGDVLIIQRYDGYQPTVQIIDGCFVCDPINSAEFALAKARGNTIYNGVEVSPTGEHVAFFVTQNDGSSVRIESMPSGVIGKKQAWLLYGLRHKITDTRGMSLLTAVLERDAKLDRFLEASVGAAEENSKIPFTFEHNQYSTGENPAMNQMAQSLGLKKEVKSETATLDGYASKIAQTTSKQVYNLPVGAQLKTNTDHSDPNFANFYTPNAHLIFSTIGIPPEVALGKYDGSYSGSRAANKGWEYKMKVERTITVTEFFYKPIYDFWFLINMYNGNITAPGYREANLSQDWLVMSAYTNCRFIGQSVPHIDPVKEATAERIKLGTAYDNIPLQTGEQACENSNSGDFVEVQRIAQKETENTSFKPIVATSKNMTANSNSIITNTVQKIIENSILDENN